MFYHSFNNLPIGVSQGTFSWNSLMFLVSTSVVSNNNALVQSRSFRSHSYSVLTFSCLGEDQVLDLSSIGNGFL